MNVVVARDLGKTYQAGAVAVPAVREASFAIARGSTKATSEPRAAFNRGERLSEFGEKPVEARYELRLRWHF